MSLAGDSDSLGVVVPTLNSATFLAETLASLNRIPLISQVILVDSGSTDGTLDIAAAAANVEILRDAPMGLYPAVNYGLRRLTTAWLTYLNGDDLLHSAGITRLLMNRDNADILYGPVDFITADGVFLHSWHSAHPHDVLRLFRAGISAVLQQGTLFRRTLFSELKGFSGSWKLVSDADFWWRAAEHGARFKRITSPPVASFRIHRGQLSQRHKSLMAEEHQQMIKAHGTPAGLLTGLYARTRYRSARWRSYLLRYLRRADIDGVCRLQGSYEF
jgi:glycosyltransferase involved in cell wall biosynthesis